MATVRESLINSVTKPLGDDLLAGDIGKVVELPVTIKASVAAMERGQILIGPVTGAAPYVDDATSDADLIIGILQRDTIATGVGETTPTNMYVAGEFNEDALIGLDAPARAKLQTMNVYAKRVDG